MKVETVKKMRRRVGQLESEVKVLRAEVNEMRTAMVGAAGVLNVDHWRRRDGGT